MQREINPSREIPKTHDKPQTSDSSSSKGEAYSYGNKETKHVVRFPISETGGEKAREAPDYPEGPSEHAKITFKHIYSATMLISSNIEAKSIAKDIRKIMAICRSESNSNLRKELQKRQEDTNPIKKEFAYLVLKADEDEDSQAK